MEGGSEVVTIVTEHALASHQPPDDQRGSALTGREKERERGRKRGRKRWMEKQRVC